MPPEPRQFSLTQTLLVTGLLSLSLATMKVALTENFPGFAAIFLFHVSLFLFFVLSGECVKFFFRHRLPDFGILLLTILLTGTYLIVAVVSLMPN